MKNSQLSFVPVSSSGFGAQAVNADLTQPIDAAGVEQVERALAMHGVVVFRNQRLNDDMQQAFISSFGPPLVSTMKELNGSHPHFIDIGTVDAAGNPINDKSIQGMYLLANQLWHTDGAQLQPPVRLTALHARSLPDDPPTTEYADMRAAWNALPSDRQAKIEKMVVEHNFLWSRQQIGMSVEDFDPETVRDRPPVHHPLVRSHSLTGEKSLYLASHASHLKGQPLEEGRKLIAELMEHATQPQFVYVHHWHPHDLVMWDNSWTMHRATPYGGPQPRKLRWCGVRELEAV